MATEKYPSISELDISELYSSEHKLGSCFKKIDVEKDKDIGNYLIKIYWNQSIYSIDRFNSKTIEDGMCLALCVNVDITDEWFLDEAEIFARFKPKCETVVVPQGVKKIVIDRICGIGGSVMSGMEFQLDH